MKITILAENTACNMFPGEHGLSLLVEYRDRKVLIDTGASGLFAENAGKMGMDLAGVNAAFLSHAHYDHSGGYPAFFAINTTAKVYLQKSAKRRHYFKIFGAIKKNIGIPEGVLDRYADRFVYVEGYRDFENGICVLPHSTPDKILQRAKRTHMCVETEGRIDFDDFSHEQTVVFEEEDGLVCVNSCSHAGVDVIVEEVKKVFPGKNIKAFFGGFHMMGLSGADSCSYSKEEVQEVAKRLLESSDAVFYSGHCTGSIAFGWLKEIMEDRLEAMASGKVFEV
ncbi:MAG: MBL fold metallo-hydrolase [Erysipelotrichaceae bacterium]|nr:MBL fold metallo-hydrolase [Erysipelotrichaceae bacterium]